MLATNRPLCRAESLTTPVLTQADRLKAMQDLVNKIAKDAAVVRLQVLALSPNGIASEETHALLGDIYDLKAQLAALS